MLTQGYLEVLHQVKHLLLGALGEVFGHVHLAHCLAEYAVGNAHGPLPAGLLLGDTAHLCAVEVKIGLIEIVGQGACGTADELGGKIILEDFKVGIFEQFAEAVEERRLLDYDLVLLGYAGRLAESLEVKTRVGLENLSRAHGVVTLHDIAVLDAGPGNCSKLVLNPGGIGCAHCGIVQAGKAEQFAEHVLVALAELCIGRIDIVVAVAHAQAALSQVEHMVLAVHQIGFDIAAEEASLSYQHKFAQAGGEFFLVFYGIQAVEILLQWSRTFSIQAGGIEALLVQVDYFLFGAAGLGGERGHARK